MAYVVLARKWRPMSFENVVGQEHVTRTIMNALKNQRIAHAYIFAGPRGIGKTTTARLLAKAVNCENRPTLNPCNICEMCKSITKGNNLDVVEIDGASNRGIDEIRNLRENIKFSPAAASSKIYIIDEVHMLTKEAFNALLKTLEEPPTHAIFILATTEIHKVPPTILSRCQRFDFKRISVGKIQEQLSKIVASEHIKIHDDALLLIAKKADGSMRDAESILDQMISFSDGQLSSKQVRESLGIIEQEVFFEFSNLLKEKDNKKILEYAHKIVSTGYDIVDFLQGLQEHLRNLILTSALKRSDLLDVSEEMRKKYEVETTSFQEIDLIHYIQMITDTIPEIKYSIFPQLALEMLLFKLVHKPSHVEIEEVLAFIKKINRNPAREMPPVYATQERNHETNSNQVDLLNDQIQSKNSSSAQASRSLLTLSDHNTVAISELDKKLSELNNNHSNPTTLEQKETESDNADINLDDFKKKWPEIVKEVGSEKIALSAFLQESVPYDTKGKDIILAYNEGATFHKEHVQKNKKFIESILQKNFNLQVNLVFKTVNFEKEGIDIQPKTPADILEDLKNKEPIIRKIIETFDLEDMT